MGPLWSLATFTSNSWIACADAIQKSAARKMNAEETAGERPTRSSGTGIILPPWKTIRPRQSAPARGRAPSGPSGLQVCQSGRVAGRVALLALGCGQALDQLVEALAFLSVFLRL